MKKFLENQRENLFLWVPFIMAAGGALYFGLNVEPHIPCSGIISVILFITVCLWRAPICVRAILAFIFGFLYANAYTNAIDTPMLNRDLRDVEISGRVSDIDYTETRARIYIRVPANNLNIKSDKIATVRVSVDTDEIPNINDTIRTTATLFMPAPSDAPGGFDFARWAYFNGITANGYADEFTITGNATQRTATNIRHKIHKSTNSILVDSLVLGYKHKLPETEHKIWTSAGVGHVWSISGFHMTLVMGWLFIIFYFIFRSVPWVVRRVPAKHIAAICAWVGLIGYVIISGVGVATLRAFLMTTLLCVAAIMGRRAFSLRNVCIVFCILFLINPYYIMTAGFQLSFSAIFGLVWFWGVVNPKMPENKILRSIVTAILTAFIASIFTAPIVAAHFYSVPLYSIIGNMILLPVFSFVIMPLVIIGMFASLIGVHFPLALADGVYNWSLDIANGIANLPFATLITPHISNIAFCLIIFGFVCMVLIRPAKTKENLVIGAAFILAGIVVVSATPRPVFMATADHELVGFVVDNNITFNKSRASNHYFTFDTWKKFAHIPTDTPNNRAKPTKGLYIFKSPKFTVAYMQKFVAVNANIARLCSDDKIDYIVSYLDINAENCEHKILRGGFIIYPSGKIIYQNHMRRWHSRHQ